MASVSLLGRTIEDSRADQRLQSWHSKAPPRDAGRHDDRSGCDRVDNRLQAHDVLPVAVVCKLTQRWENTICAPNIQACSHARRVSSWPLMPCPKPG